ncbi:helix-turn-helix transcriptional regulator [Curtobacterium sp. TXMA1]|uniref:helix-turn-helix transcriptional regulator n=1 Tax=Curtobacterium sp. TXMA1 TaxID=2876939 RepID=UPI001CCE2D69|nr:helix-turn-helix transcriptional regulator [Curtobacterium sp. TXMA1]UBQ02245.1 helix-turn-helix transcriptional regulator [Curtobacterium sp. TXMA1]
MIDRPELGAYLRARREALQPSDVGLPPGQRRRTAGLRREEVAALCHMSADYYARLERGTGPQPSEQMVAAIAQGLHLSRAERDHVFRLAGHRPPESGAGSDHVGPGMMRIFDRLVDTPAEVVTELGETLLQTPLAAALFGDASQRQGPSRSIGWRWFTEAGARDLFPPEDRDTTARLYVSSLREVATRRGAGSRAAQLADELLQRSDEFRALWDRHEVGLVPGSVKRYDHPEVGRIELHCQVLLDPEQAHVLLVYTAVPGTESHDRLRLLSVVAA